jgi:hypothetical protein
MLQYNLIEELECLKNTASIPTLRSIQGSRPVCCGIQILHMILWYCMVLKCDWYRNRIHSTPFNVVPIQGLIQICGIVFKMKSVDAHILPPEHVFQRNHLRQRKNTHPSSADRRCTGDSEESWAYPSRATIRLMRQQSGLHNAEPAAPRHIHHRRSLLALLASAAALFPGSGAKAATTSRLLIQWRCFSCRS